MSFEKLRAWIGALPVWLKRIFGGRPTRDPRAPHISEMLAGHAVAIAEELTPAKREQILAEGDFGRATFVADRAVTLDRSGRQLLDAPKLTVHEAQFADGTELGLFEVGGVPVCFFGGVSFHPGRVADDRTKPGKIVPTPDYEVSRNDSGGGRLFILDTGWVDGDPPCEADEENFPVPNPPDLDLVVGHGPAIVDIVQTIMGTTPNSSDPDDRVFLMQPDYFGGALEGATLVPAIDEDLTPTGKYVRAVDLKAVNDALERIYELIEPGDVLNLSLGTVVHPDVVEDPSSKPEFARLLGLMDDFTSEEKQVVVVAAAGNHGCEAEMWPAAHPEVIAVGSADVDPQGNKQNHDFTGRGDWVKHFVDGDEVPVNANGKFPKPPLVTQRSATWSGTSFAAPKIAALKAQGDVIDLTYDVWTRP